jgi:soluble lytic murein transglycosylase-like protein
LLLLILILGLSSCILSDESPEAQQVAAVPAETTIHVDPDEDLSLILYRRPESREAIIEFYTAVTAEREIAELILHYADTHEVPASLAFSLAYAESRFIPSAINRNSSSIDRGLFQLNSRSFPKMSEAEFFDPRINTDTGVGYLRYCLDVGENTVVALAMYNAGRTRVTERGAPKMTLDYIAKILTFQGDLEDRIETSLVTKQTYAEKEDAKEGKRLSYVLDKSKALK